MLIIVLIILATLLGYYFGYNQNKEQYEKYMKEIHDIYLEKLIKDDGE